MPEGIDKQRAGSLVVTGQDVIVLHLDVASAAVVKDSRPYSKACLSIDLHSVCMEQQR